MFISRNIQKLRDWWQSPATAKDRVVGGLVGGFGGFWIGVLGRIGFGALPVSLGEVAIWALATAACGLGIGIAFPKPITVVLFPFSFFG